VIAALFLCLALFLLAGVPVAFALGLSGLVAVLVEGGIPLEVVPQRSFAALDSWPLMAVPLFILAGELMNACGISRRGIAIVGRLRGGLPLVSVISSVFFASLTGSSSASTAAVGSILIPAMRERGYPVGFAAALQAAGGALGPIIPPSIIMIVVGYVTETSIAALFVAGIVPGVVIGVALVLTSYSTARRYEKTPPPRAEGGSLAATLKQATPAIGMPLVVLGGILAGIFTATEAAGVAVAYSLIVGRWYYREIRAAALPGIFGVAALRSCVVMFVATSAYLFAWIVAVGRVPDEVGRALSSVAGSPLAFLFATHVILIVIGMFMETISAVIVMMPILFPLAMNLGVDPVHFGVLVTVNFCIGMVTPPYGATLFVACTIAGKSVSEIAPWTLRPVLTMLIVLVLLTLFPAAVTGPAQLLGVR
jgi:C4-dicarboxylate transporter DctM subunit